MTKPATLRIRGHIEVRELHWLLWAESERQHPASHLGYGSQWQFLPSPSDDEGAKSVRAIQSWEPRDDDIAAAVGQGVERLGFVLPNKAKAIRARYAAASDVILMRDLARRLGVTPARVSQMADEGQQDVESWVVETYGT